ncbi:MAG: twin-arginine translocase TatA/TatE family subunit [Gemmatimonadota bacterium]|nr:MAG: twin-arginine translocase TatA/TatE family subunit [Gemmatimonadota bacterium]
MPFNLGMTEILVILMILLLVFGAKRLPEMGAGMGKGIREFKKSLKDVKNSIENDVDEVPTSRQIDSAPAPSDGEPKKLSE